VTKTVWLYDSHCPYNIPLKPLISYLKDEQPQVFGLGGDNIDFGCISHWNDANFRHIGFDQVRKNLKHEAGLFREQLAAFRRALPKSDIIYIPGNHEAWLTGFCEKYPQMGEGMDLESLLGLKKLKIKLQPNRAFYKLGKLYFCHGDQVSGQKPAEKFVTRYQRNIVFGHFHSCEIAPNYSPLDSKNRHMAIQVPCYRTLEADYMNGKATKWCHGFFWAHIRPSGNFTAGLQFVSPDGAFITQSGKEYR